MTGSKCTSLPELDKPFVSIPTLIEIHVHVHLKLMLYMFAVYQQN